MMSRLERLLRELRAVHDDAAVASSLGALSVVHEGDVAIVRREAAHERLFDATDRRAQLVRIERDVYRTTPTRSARVRLLSAARAVAPRIEVHAPTVSAGTHVGRIFIDVPRRAGQLLGVLAEPGDRFDGSFAHAFFDDEALIREAEAASLRLVTRRRAWIVLEAARPYERREEAAPFSREVALALRTIGDAERERRARGPAEAVATMRGHGSARPARGPIGRARLRRAIGWVDACHPGGGNCFRRVLAELALDGGAAREPLVFGLDVGATGHVAFRDAEEPAFDVAFEISSGSP